MKSTRMPWVYEGLSNGQKICVAASGLIAVATKAQPEQLATKFGSVGPYLFALLSGIQQWAWLLTPSLLLAAMVLGWAKKKYGDPEIWKELQSLIDVIRNDVFGKIQGCYQHHYRVTLYQHRKWCLSKSWLKEWLVPVIRSGHTSKANVREFSINRRRAGSAQGVAGRAWESEGHIHIQGLDDITGACSDDTLTTYADLTNVTLKELKKKVSHAQSFWAVRVEAKGRPWGVLVIDTVAPTVNSLKAKNSHTKNAQFLSLLLQRA